MIRSIVTALAATALMGVPVAASAAPAANPAASLSLNPSVRTGAPQRHASKLGSGFNVYTVVLLAALAGLVIAATTNSDSA